jgi:hypothetical protein
VAGRKNSARPTPRPARGRSTAARASDGRAHASSAAPPETRGGSPGCGGAARRSDACRMHYRPGRQRPGSQQMDMSVGRSEHFPRRVVTGRGGAQWRQWEAAPLVPKTGGKDGVPGRRPGRRRRRLISHHPPPMRTHWARTKRTHAHDSKGNAASSRDGQKRPNAAGRNAAPAAASNLAPNRVAHKHTTASPLGRRGTAGNDLESPGNLLELSSQTNDTLITPGNSARSAITPARNLYSQANRGGRSHAPCI